MSSSARVTSLDALKTFRAALCEFRADAKDALGAAELEIRHVLDWLQQQLKHWRAEVRRCEEDVVRAKAELVQRKYSKADRRGYTEPELALKKATARLEEAQQKVERTRHWIRALPQEVTEYEGPARQLAGMLDAELTRAIALLGQRIEALEAYVQTAPPTIPQPPPTAENPPRAGVPAGQPGEDPEKGSGPLKSRGLTPFPDVESRR